MITTINKILLADDDMFMNGDASSQSSMNSYKCSNFQYCHSVNEHTIVDGNKHNNKTSTRPHRAELDEANISKLQLGYSTKDSCNFRCGASSHGCSGQTKVRSYVDDRRSQQVQRSMILEMYKNRNSNTIGGVEGIGFQPPKRGGRIRRLSLDE